MIRLDYYKRTYRKLPVKDIYVATLYYQTYDDAKSSHEYLNASRTILHDLNQIEESEITIEHEITC